MSSSDAGPVRELLAGSTRLAYEAMSELRPDLGSAGAFVERVDEIQRPEGYRLAGAFADGVEPAVAVAGFRLGHNLAWGRFLYVDDLVTMEAHRRGGHAARLMTWLRDLAVGAGCDQLHLDSGTHRHGAHAFYLGIGMSITSFHFALNLWREDADQ